MSAPLLLGFRIIVVEQYGAGPFGSMYLADLGAEVIKIESPVTGGDISRHTGPYFLGENDSHFFQTFNRNKRSLKLDLKQAEGRALFHKLVATSDAVMNNLRGDLPATLGLDYASLKAINPRIVCAHLSAYGRDNSRASWPGYDYLMQAEAGYMALTGDPASPPQRFGLSLVDFMTGVTCSTALLAALLGVSKRGTGCDVDVSLFDVALHQMSYPATWYLNERHITQRMPRSAHPSTVPCQLYTTSDGWLFVMAMTEKFWDVLVDGVGRPELKKDPRFVDFNTRRAHRAELETLLDEAFSARTTAEWARLFEGRMPVAAVNSFEQALDNDYLYEIGMIQSLPHPQRGDLRVLANPIRVNGERLPGAPCSPLGGDTEALLGELGYNEADIAALRAAAVV